MTLVQSKQNLIAFFWLSLIAYFLRAFLSEGIVLSHDKR